MEPGHNDRLLTIPEAIQAPRTLRTHIFRLKRRGEIVGIQLGHRTLIPQ